MEAKYISLWLTMVLATVQMKKMNLLMKRLNTVSLSAAVAIIFISLKSMTEAQIVRQAMMNLPMTQSLKKKLPLSNVGMEV